MLTRCAFYVGIMHARKNHPVYESSVRFDANRIRAAAVYCSDERFGEQFDDFLHQSLRLPRYDRLAVPGGPACLASHFASHSEQESVIEQLRFLVNVHGLERVVLIAHENCAFYTERMHVPPPQLESQQQDDLVKAIRRVNSLSLSLTVDAFFARVGANGVIQFECLES